MMRFGKKNGESPFQSTRRLFEGDSGSSAMKHQQQLQSTKSIDDQAAEAYDKMPQVFDMYDDSGSDFGFVPSSALMEGLDAPATSSEQPSTPNRPTLMRINSMKKGGGSVGSGGGLMSPVSVKSLSSALSSPASTPARRMSPTSSKNLPSLSQQQQHQQHSSDNDQQQNHHDMIHQLITQFQIYHPDMREKLDHDEFETFLHLYSNHFDVGLKDLCMTMMDQLDDLAELEQRSPESNPVIKIRRKLWERLEFGSTGMARLKSSRQLMMENNNNNNDNTSSNKNRLDPLSQSERSHRSNRRMYGRSTTTTTARGRYGGGYDTSGSSDDDEYDEDEIPDEVMNEPQHKRSWQLFRFRLALQDLRKKRDSSSRRSQHSLKEESGDDSFQNSFGDDFLVYEKQKVDRKSMALEEKNNKAALAVWEILVTAWTRHQEEEQNDRKKKLQHAASGSRRHHHHSKLNNSFLSDTDEESASTSTPCSNKENQEEEPHDMIEPSPIPPPTSTLPQLQQQMPLSASDEKALEEAWTILPRLFDVWDSDGSGSLDQAELFGGVEQYCEAHGLDFDSRQLMSIFHEVDDNKDRKLDRREFAVFLQLLSQRVEGYSLLRLANYMMSQLMEITVPNVNSNHGGSGGIHEDDSVSVLTMSSCQQHYYQKTMEAHQANNRLHKKALRAVSQRFSKIPGIRRLVIGEEGLKRQLSSSRRGWNSEQMELCVSSKDVPSPSTPRRSVSLPVSARRRRSNPENDSTVAMNSSSIHGGSSMHGNNNNRSSNAGVGDALQRWNTNPTNSTSKAVWEEVVQSTRARSSRNIGGGPGYGLSKSDRGSSRRSRYNRYS